MIAAVALLPLLGVRLALWWSSGLMGKLAAVLVLILLAPRTLRNAWYYSQETINRSEQSATWYSTDRLALLGRLRELTTWSDLILVSPENQDLRHASVIPALAGRKTYLSNQYILESHNWDFGAREQQIKDVLAVTSWSELVTRARELGLTWLYLEEQDESQLAAVIPSSQVYFANAVGKIISLEFEVAEDQEQEN